ncbi:MAG TPA: L,D-transpeptidase family protein [Flavobacteriales bacterium]|nr:L,D-transpeptidase family protein [Flavobacteriales bacterium]
MLSEELKTIVSNEPLVIDSLFLLSGSEISRFYAAREHAPFWINETDTLRVGSMMMGVLDSAWCYGIDPDWLFYSRIRSLFDSCRLEDNYVIKAKHLARADVLLTNAFFLQTTFLAEGFIDTASMGIAWKKDSLTIDFSDYLGSVNDTNLFRKLFAFQPDFIEYRQLQSALSQWAGSREMWDDKFEVPDPKKDSLGFWDMARRSLRRNGFLDSSSLVVDTLVVKALKDLQMQHRMDVDGKPGRQSTWALGLSNYDRFLRAALAMEKWRWKYRSDPQMQFRINIPSYELNVIRNDSIIYRARVVTGATDHQTPELHATVRYFTLFPYWNVPHSISTEEILPFVKRDTNYLHKHNYRVFDLKRNPVAIADVDWKRLSKDRFPYFIRQEGGPTNSLGLIVFFFPNKHDVYLHDTPMKPLFNREVRNFSHGCMRLQNPFKLGEIVWKDQWPKDTVNADTLRNRAIRFGKETRFALKRRIPIEVDYITVTADSIRNIWFHYDVYARDEKYLEIIRRLRPKH